MTDDEIVDMVRRKAYEGGVETSCAQDVKNIMVANIHGFIALVSLPAHATVPSVTVGQLREATEALYSSLALNLHLFDQVAALETALAEATPAVDLG